MCWGGGDLIILIGENNIGKSNVIDALKALGNRSISESDKPNFLGYEESKPSLKLIHSELSSPIANQNDKNSQRKLDKSFETKVFNIVFTEGSLEKGASEQGMPNDKYIAFCKDLLNKSKEKLCLHDLDTTKSKPRQEIRLILKDLGYVFLCSAQLGKDLKCFRVMKKTHDNIQNIDKAFIANCEFDIETAHQLDNANELKKILKEYFEQWKDENQQSDDLKGADRRFVEFTYSDEVGETIDKQATIKAVGDKFKDFDELFSGYYDERRVAFNELYEEWKQYKYSNEMQDDEFEEQITSFYTRLQEIYFDDIAWKEVNSYHREIWLRDENIALLEAEFDYFDDVFDNNENNKYKDKFERLQRKWDKFKRKFEDEQENYIDKLALDKLRVMYMKLQDIFLPFLAMEYQQGSVVIKGDKSLIPQVIDYKEQKLDDDDLTTEPELLEESLFFQSLCAILDTDRQKWIDIIAQHYEKGEVNTFKRKKLEKSINEAVKKSITKRFNELYFGTDEKEIYAFEVNLEEYKIEFLLSKNDEPLKLSQQSTGFQWFFNFFFNFLHCETLKGGDIVLLDELGGNLSIPTQRDLRAFLKDFAKRNNITFVIATHTPYLTDINHLDELRIIAQSEKNSGVQITNSFAILDKGELDALACIKKAFGTDNHFSMMGGNSRIVFVEGITDYNYLTKFKLLYEKEKGELDIAFLPIGGLGEFKDEQSKLTDKQKTIIKELPIVARANKERYAVLLVDSDKVGKALKKAVESDKANNKNLGVVTIDEILRGNDKFTTIESLFSENDRKRHKEILDAKNDERASGTLATKHFKNTDTELEKETKENFYKLLEYLNGFISANE